jgi:hypothetical protein
MQNPPTTSNAGSVSTSTAKPWSIYVVPGSETKSGKPYVGRHNKPDPVKTRRSLMGEIEVKLKSLTNIPANDTQAGRVKEQEQIDKHGGVPNLDNKRNEIAPK